jgi:hypothetical protein
MKTFYCSWQGKQDLDGTVTWTSPSGHIYLAEPSGALFFPQVAKPTGKLVLPDNIPGASPLRGQLMDQCSKHDTPSALKATSPTAGARSRSRTTLQGESSAQRPAAQKSASPQPTTTDRRLADRFPLGVIAVVV